MKTFNPTRWPLVYSRLCVVIGLALIAAVSCSRKDDSGGPQLATIALTQKTSPAPVNTAPLPVAEAPQPEPASKTGRPDHLPCLIVSDMTNKTGTAHQLLYDYDTRQLIKTNTHMVLWSDDKPQLLNKGTETSYSYGDDGRLQRVTRSLDEGLKKILTIKYDSDGYISSYQLEETLFNGEKNKHVGTVNYGPERKVLNLKERGRVFMGGMQDSTENHDVVFGQQKSLYQGTVIVWPFDMDTPYLGWASDGVETVVSGKYGGRLNTWNEYTFGSDGRITSWKTDNGIKMNFIYDCRTSGQKAAQN